MRRHPEEICPNCHQQPVEGKSTSASDFDRKEEAPEYPLVDDREYDHRGIALPRRTRVGGIIMPQ